MTVQPTDGPDGTGPADDGGDARPWERQPHEGQQPWLAFQIYRDLTTERTVTEVAKRVQKSHQLLYRWSARYGWHDRVLAFDREQDRLWREFRFAEKVRANRRQLRIAQNAVVKATLLTGNQATGDPGMDPSLPATRAVREHVSWGMEIERKILGIGEEDGSDSVGVRIVIDSDLLPDGAQLPTARDRGELG